MSELLEKKWFKEQNPGPTEDQNSERDEYDRNMTESSQTLPQTESRMAEITIIDPDCLAFGKLFFLFAFRRSLLAPSSQ